MQSFRNTVVAIEFFDKKVRAGRNKLYVETFLSHSDEITRRGIFSVSLISGVGKCYG